MLIDIVLLDIFLSQETLNLNYKIKNLLNT